MYLIIPHTNQINSEVRCRLVTFILTTKDLPVLRPCSFAGLAHQLLLGWTAARVIPLLVLHHPHSQSACDPCQSKTEEVSQGFRGGFVKLIAFFLENKDCLRINWIPNVMVQFCYSRLDLGINIVSRHVLLQIAWKDTTWIETLKTWANFSTLRLPKAPKIIIVSAPW